MSFNIETILGDISANDICIDCGANVGKITQLIADTGATVHAFEPNPFAFKKLQERFRDNDKVICYNMGVLDRKTSIPLYLHVNSDEDEVLWSTGSSMLEFKSNVDNNKKVMVETVDLDEFIINLGSDVRFVKMDVEGVEIEIINKLIDSNTIQKIGFLVAETHEHKIPELVDPTQKLRERLVNDKIDNVDLDWI